MRCDRRRGVPVASAAVACALAASSVRSAPTGTGEDSLWHRTDNAGFLGTVLQTDATGRDVPIRECKVACFGLSACDGFAFNGSCWPVQGLRPNYSEDVLGTSIYTKRVSPAGSCAGVDKSRKVEGMVMYHISKCGGSTLNNFFGNEPGLTDAGKPLWQGERENSCMPEYCGRNPGNVFLLGTVRNPFAFYLSYWHMIVKDPDPWGYACIGPEFVRLGMTDVYDTANLHNATTFGRWLRVVLGDLKGECHGSAKSMGRIWDSMMLETANAANDGTFGNVTKDHEDEGQGKGDGGGARGVVYDSMVQLEDFYPSLERALAKFECYAGAGKVNWEWLQQKAAQGRSGIGNFNEDRGVSPYWCFYDAASRALVEQSDGDVLERFGYSLESLKNDHNLNCSNVVH